VRRVLECACALFVALVAIGSVAPMLPDRWWRAVVDVAVGAVAARLALGEFARARREGLL
jgi:hypothetical protein